MRVNVSGVWKPVTKIKVNIGGAWRSVTQLRANVAGVWKPAGSFVASMSASIDDNSPTGLTFGNTQVDTNTVTVTPSGGLPPYTYSWARLSGTGSAFSPTSAATFFRDAVANFAFSSGTFRCTVSDSQSPPATATVDAFATFENAGPLGP